MDDLENGAVHAFAVGEQRDELFALLSGVDLVRVTSGGAVALADITAWFESTRATPPGTVVVPPNPLHGFAFPTVRENLLISARRRVRPTPTFADVTATFRVGSLLDRSISTLSGGERCRVALARAALQSREGNVLVLCNPESWLSISARDLVLQTLSVFEGLHGWHFLGLRGEDLVTRLSGNGPDSEAIPSATWLATGRRFSLELRNVSTTLRDPTGFSRSLPTTLRYSTEPIGGLDLQSPAMLIADNGAGKSVLAKLLAGALPLGGGTSLLDDHISQPGTRLLSQEYSFQLFGLSPSAYMNWMCRRVPSLSAAFHADYHSLLGRCVELIEKTGERAYVNSRSPETALEARIALAATRVQVSTRLLVIDEPSFGLSRVVASAFLDSVTELCAARGIAVVFATHSHEWFGHLAASVVRMRTLERIDTTGISREVVLYESNRWQDDADVAT